MGKFDPREFVPLDYDPRGLRAQAPPEEALRLRFEVEGLRSTVVQVLGMHEAAIRRAIGTEVAQVLAGFDFAREVRVHAEACLRQAVEVAVREAMVEAVHDATRARVRALVGEALAAFKEGK